ncbi:lantibiotic biosynthesis protein, partial [Shewanella abyssi]|uniref:lanthionine synthetase LanC family protein n=1 Tax=Shewanella abyssi TaxID=311789 RepID=UPI0024B049F2
YAARRLKRSSDPRLYEKIITHYEALAIQVNEQQLSWPQASHSVFRLNTENLDEIEFNLGLAHGVPGIIAAILPALAIPQLEKRVQTLLTHSCNWLIEQQITTEEREVGFPCSVGSDSIARLGWCYGDLPIALTLARVGRDLKLDRLIEAARHIAIRTSKRTADDGSIFDAGLCHGSSGLIIMFQLLNEILDEPELEQAALRWLDFTLQRFTESGLAGLNAYSGISKQYE